MTIKEYAKSRGVSYEAAAKQVRKYKNKELKSHISYQGSLTILDDYAVDLLDGHRQPRNIIVEQTSEDIQRELKRLYNEVDKLKDQIIALQDEKTALIEYKVKNEQLQLIADKSQSELNQTTQELEQLKIDAAVARTANDNLAKEKAQMQEQMEQAKEELNRYKPTLFGLYRKI